MLQNSDTDHRCVTIRRAYKLRTGERLSGPRLLLPHSHHCFGHLASTVYCGSVQRESNFKRCVESPRNRNPGYEFKNDVKGYWRQGWDGTSTYYRSSKTCSTSEKDTCFSLLLCHILTPMSSSATPTCLVYEPRDRNVPKTVP